MAFIGQDQIPIVEDYRQIGGIPSVCISQNPKLACQTKTIAALPPYVATGASQGKRLTAVANGYIGMIDGYAPVFGDRILVDSDGTTTDVDNGIYTVWQIGTATTPWILIRATDADQNYEIVSGLAVSVTLGATTAGYGYTVLTPNPIIIDTTPFTFTNTSTPPSGVPGVATWAQTLVAGNLSGGTNPVLSSGDVFAGQDIVTGGPMQIRGGNATVMNNAGGNVELTGGAGLGSGAGGDIVLTSGTTGTGGTGDINLIIASPGAGGPVGNVLISGAGSSSGAGTFNFTTGSAGSTGNGGTFTMATGNGGATSGNGGTINILPGDATFGNGGIVNILAGDVTVGPGQGGRINITSGTTPFGIGGILAVTTGAGGGPSAGGDITTITGIGGSGGGRGGNYSINLGSGGGGAANGGAFTVQTGGGAANGNGGQINIATGAGGAAAGNGGNISITSGSSPTANGGVINIISGPGSVNGGAININTSASTGTGTGGDITVTTGAGGTNTRAGDIIINLGTGGNTTGRGGAFSLQTGTGGSNANSGNINLATGAAGAAAGNSGSITLTTGSSSTGNGGSINLLGGPGAVNGGSVNITANTTGNGAINLNSITNMSIGLATTSTNLFRVSGITGIPTSAPIGGGQLAYNSIAGNMYYYDAVGAVWQPWFIAGAPSAESFSVAGGANQNPDITLETSFVTTTGAGNATGTLANGTALGQVKYIIMSAGHTSNYVLTITAGIVDAAGVVYNTATFTTGGQSMAVMWDTVNWINLNSGVALS